MERLLHPGAWLDRFTRWVAFIGLVGLLIVSIVTMIDVLMRWLFSAPIEGYEDITRLLFAIIVAACFPAGLLQGRNITIRFLGKALGARATMYLEALGAIATLFFFTVVTWRVAIFALDEVANNRFTQTLEISTGPWWCFVSVLLLMCVPVQFVIAWVKSSAAITGKPLQYADNEMSI